jgi:protein disulfide-isomerase A1
MRNRGKKKQKLQEEKKKDRMVRRVVAVLLGLSVLCSFLSHVLCDEIDETDVVVLDKDNINEEMKKATHMLVEFYAPWCGHCKELAPHWARAATAIKNAVPVVVVAKVDVEKNPELGERFGVEGFPALKWLTGYPNIFAQGEFADYDGGRTDSEIVAWVKKKFLPPCKQLNTTEDLAMFKGSEEVVIMAFLDQSAVTTPCTSPFCDVWKTYEAAARKANDLTFAYTVNKDVHENATFKTGDVVMYKRHTKLGPIEELLFKKVDGTIQDLVSWVQIERLPIVTEFSQAYSDLIFKAPVDAQALLIARKHEDHAKSAHEALHTVAKDFRGKFVAVFVDAEAHPKVMQHFSVTIRIKYKIYIRVMEHFGVTTKETPCIY